MLSNQEIFNKVHDHLLKQNARASKIGLDGETQCMYRTPSGLTCAVGCLIYPNAYTPLIEGFGCHQQTVRDVLLASDIDASISNTRYLLEELQECHDRVDVKDWASKLSEIAVKFNLTP
jgi:hypothetical protein